MIADLVNLAELSLPLVLGRYPDRAQSRSLGVDDVLWHAVLRCFFHSLNISNAARFGKPAIGRIYGFVYSGLDLGLACAPLFFGGLMDQQAYGSVLIGIAIFQSLAIFTALRVGKLA